MTNEAATSVDTEIAVVLLDQTGAIVDAHQNCGDILGWQRGELLGKDVGEILQYGRDLLLSQLQLLTPDESEGHTSFSVRVLARRKDKTQFPARVTIRRFPELECWTAAFYQLSSEADPNLPPIVSPEEISLAMRALEETKAAAPDAAAERAKAPSPAVVATPGRSSWRNSRLLFSFRKKDGSSKGDPAVDRSCDPSPSTGLQELEQAAFEKALLHDISPAAELLKGPAPLPEPLPPVVAPLPAQRADDSLGQKERADLQRQLSESITLLARAKSELEKERTERNRLERRASSLSAQVQSLHLNLSENLKNEHSNEERFATLERDLCVSRERASRDRASLESERMQRASLENELRLKTELNSRLESSLAAFNDTRVKFEAVETELGDLLAARTDALAQATAALAEEKKRTAALEATAAAAHGDLLGAAEDSRLSLSRLEAALQNALFEKQRLEEESFRLRAEAISSTRELSLEHESFRQQLADRLQTTSRTASDLVQAELPESARQTAEKLAAEILSVQTLVHCEGAVQNAAPEASAVAA